jgi:hypothetical protein
MAALGRYVKLNIETHCGQWSFYKAGDLYCLVLRQPSSDKPINSIKIENELISISYN